MDRLLFVEIGCAAGFTTYLLTVSGLAPQWWYRFVDWYKAHIYKSGKPFTCELCMSFWLSIFFYACVVLQQVIIFKMILIDLRDDTIPLFFASALISLISSKALDRLNTYYMSAK